MAIKPPFFRFNKVKVIKTILFIFLGHFTFGQTKVQKIDSFLIAFGKTIKFNGNVLIAEKGNVIYNKSFGAANQTTGKKLNSNSIFELASVTKQFTAMAIVLLKEQGKINYEDKISKYLPELGFYNITIKNLLTHTSGLAEYAEVLDSAFDKNKIATNKDVIEFYSKLKPVLQFEPNTKWEYSNTGYVLLASIIEKVSGISYGRYLEQAIFKPLKLTNTFVYNRRYSPKKVNNYAYGYFYSDSLKKYLLPDSIPEVKKVIWLDGTYGDASLNSTVIDLLKWDRALYSSKLISAKAKNEIFTSSKLQDSTKTDYGFGWFIEDNGIYGKLTFHRGGWPGYRTIIDRHTDNDKTIIVLLNYVNSDSTYIPIKELRQLLYNIEPIKYIELTNEEKQLFVGEYRNTKTGTIAKLVFENGNLYRLYDDASKLLLKAVSNTKFQLTENEPDVFYEFTIEDGKVIKYVLTQPEMKVKKEAVKIK